jgi:hypothetical protein
MVSIMSIVSIRILRFDLILADVPIKVESITGDQIAGKDNTTNGLLMIFGYSFVGYHLF